MPRLLCSSSLSRKEASIRSVRLLPHLVEKKPRRKESKKKRGREKARASRPERRKGDRKGDTGRKRGTAWGSAERVSARWISAKFERALTCEKCQSEQKNRGRKRARMRGRDSEEGRRGERVRDATVVAPCTYGCVRSHITCARIHICMCKCIYVFKIERMREARGEGGMGERA